VTKPEAIYAELRTRLLDDLEWLRKQVGEHEDEWFAFERWLLDRRVNKKPRSKRELAALQAAVDLLIFGVRYPSPQRKRPTKSRPKRRTATRKGRA
jgi:hypothetical protein